MQQPSKTNHKPQPIPKRDIFGGAILTKEEKDRVWRITHRIRALPKMMETIQRGESA